MTTWIILTTALAARAASAADAPLVVKVDGETWPIQSQIVYTHGGEALRVELSTAELACSDVQGMGRVLKPGEKTLSFTVAPKIASDGTSSWQIRTLFLPPRNLVELGPATVTGPAEDGGVQIGLKLDLPLDASEFLKLPEGRLSVQGELNTTTCGVLPRNKGVSSSPQPELELTFAGVPFAITGATVGESFGKPVLRLSTQPHDCDTSMVGSDFSVALTLSEDDKTVPEGLINGDRVDQNINFNVKDGSFTYAVDPKGSTTLTKDAQGLPQVLSNVTSVVGRGPKLIHVSGEADAAGHPLKVKGTVRASGCEPK